MEIEALLEGERRGLLDPELKAALAELRKRGLAGNNTESPAASDPSLATIPQQQGLLSQIASGAWQGLQNIGSGVAQLPGVLVNTPGRVMEDVAALATNPSEAIPQMVERGKTFAKGMIPLRETGGAILSGEMPSAETAARETTELAGGYLGTKYVPPAIAAGAKRTVRGLPGAAVELNEVAAGKLRAIPEAVRPTPGLAQRTYAMLDQIQAPPVLMAETRATAQRLLQKELSLADPDRTFVKTLRNYLAKSQRGMSFKDIQNNVVDLGEKVGQHAASKGTKLAEMRDMLGALHADAAQAVPFGGASAHPALQVKSGVWDAARLLARRDFAANDLARMIEKSGISTVGDGFTQVNTNKIVSQIEDMLKLATQDKRAKLFVESFPPGELDGIVSTLKAIGKAAPKIPPKTGTPVGSSQRWIEAGIGGLAGTAVGSTLGHAGVGATVGGLSGPIASHLLAKALMSNSGRTLVRKSLGPTGTVTPQSAALLAMYLKAEGEQP